MAHITFAHSSSSSVFLSVECVCVVYIIAMQYSSDVFLGFVFISAWSKGVLLEMEHCNLLAMQISKYTMLDDGSHCVDMQMFLVLLY